MSSILNTLVTGQAAMLKRNAVLVGALALASVVPAVTGVITKEPAFVSLGVSNAVIDLAVAYMLGNRIVTRREALAAAGNKVAALPKKHSLPPRGSTPPAA